MKALVRGFVEEGFTLFHNYSAFSVLILGILFYSLLYPLPYRNETPQKLPLLVVDQDNSTTSRTLLRMLDATEGVSVDNVYTNAAHAQSDLRDGKGQAVLIIPNDFERNVLRGAGSTLPIYLDAGYLLIYRVAYKGIKLAVENMGAGVRVEQFKARGMPELAALSLQVRGQVNVRTLYNPAGNYAMSVIPAVFVLILQQTLLIGSAMLAGRLTLGPRRPKTRGVLYLSGRLLFLTCLFIIHALYYMWLLPMFYDLPRAGSTGEMVLFLLPFFLACGAAGSALGMLVPRGEYVLAVLLPCSLPFLFLSGFTWPVEAMPSLVRLAGEILPSTPAINGYLYMSQRGATLAEIMPLWWQLWGQALFFFAVAWVVEAGCRGGKGTLMPRVDGKSRAAEYTPPRPLNRHGKKMRKAADGGFDPSASRP